MSIHIYRFWCTVLQDERARPHAEAELVRVQVCPLVYNYSRTLKPELRLSVNTVNESSLYNSLYKTPELSFLKGINC